MTKRVTAKSKIARRAVVRMSFVADGHVRLTQHCEIM